MINVLRLLWKKENNKGISKISCEYLVGGLSENQETKTNNQKSKEK
jgi:hypothetical protein|tara:strand:+ start:38 stop:175 length:138 start_codon:yes stop_codon:yes gene_type:complete